MEESQRTFAAFLISWTLFCNYLKYNPFSTIQPIWKPPNRAERKKHMRAQEKLKFQRRGEYLKWDLHFIISWKVYHILYTCGLKDRGLGNLSNYIPTEKSKIKIQKEKSSQLWEHNEHRIQLLIQLRNLKENHFLTDSDLINASSSKQQCDQLQLFVGNRAP